MSRVNSPSNARGSVAFAQVGVIGFDVRIEIEALRPFELSEAAPAGLYASLSVPIGTWSLALETTCDLPSTAISESTSGFVAEHAVSAA